MMKTMSQKTALARLHPQLVNLITRTPSLQSHRRRLVGCCRISNDRVLTERIKTFLIEAPQFEDVLRPLLESHADPH